MSYEQANYLPEEARSAAFDCVSAVEGPGVTRLTLTGELDLATISQVRAALTSAAQEAKLVVVDLSELTFIDCAAVKTIVTADARLRAADRRLALVRAQPQVQRIFELAGLADRLSVTNDCSSA